MTGAAIAGVGYSPFTRASGRSVLDQALEACSGAIDDAGLDRSAVDGIASFMVLHDSVPAVAVATGLALPQLRFSLDVQLGGQAPCYLVTQAAAAIATGQADHVLVYRAMNGKSGARVGTMRFPGLGEPYRHAVGYDAYLMYVAMWARRFLFETGQDELDLGAVAVAQRAFALENARAVKRRPLDLDAYLASPPVVEPFRADDCTTEVDGACAVLVTSLERARDLRHPPAVVASGAYRAGARPGLDIGDHLFWDDYTRNYTSLLADDLFGRAGVTSADVELARDLRLLHQHGARRAGRTRVVWAGRVGCVRTFRGHGDRGHAADQHARRVTRRGLPARHEHRGRSCAPGVGPRAGEPGSATRRVRGDVGRAHGRLGPAAHERSVKSGDR